MPRLLLFYDSDGTLEIDLHTKIQLQSLCSEFLQQTTKLTESKWT